MQNMLCAFKLPGSENTDIPKCLTRLDYVTSFVKDTIDKNIHRRPPGSEAVWRMASMVTSIKRDFGAVYDPTIRDNVTAGLHSKMDDSAKLFLHGMLGDDPNKRFGSCASLPALVVAVARRLKYPVTLACAGRHIYARWDGDGNCFNMEVSNPGAMVIVSDDHLKPKLRKVNWPVKSDNGYYMRSLRPAEELGLFLTLRVECLCEAALYESTIYPSAIALQLSPDDPQFPHTAHYATDLAIRSRLVKLEPHAKLPPLGQPFHFEIPRVFRPDELLPFTTISAHLKEARGELEPARAAYEDACRMKYNGTHEQRDLQRFIKKHGPARRAGPLMPPMNCQRLLKLRCQPQEEAVMLRRLADQSYHTGDLVKARDMLHDLYMFNPADAAVFNNIKAIESGPQFRAMIEKSKRNFRN